MTLGIKKEQFDNWLSSHEVLSSDSPHHLVVEHYFNEVLIQGVYNSVISSVSQLEQTDAYENGTLISELLENEVSAFLYSSEKS